MADISGFGAAAYGRQQTADPVDRNENESFREMLADYRLRRIDGTLSSGFTVESDSGATYRVTLDAAVGGGGGYLRSLWACNCKARGRCRHITACEQVVASEAAAAGDIETMEMMERVAN